MQSWRILPLGFTGRRNRGRHVRLLEHCAPGTREPASQAAADSSLTDAVITATRLRWLAVMPAVGMTLLGLDVAATIWSRMCGLLAA